MFDYEGSRSEFLKLLAECGEEPAFIARARAPQIALDVLLDHCKAKREEILKWPKFHLSVLAHRVGNDWTRLGRLLPNPESVTMLEALHASMPSNRPVKSNRLTSDRAALSYLDGLDLEPVNKPRRDFNQFYALEKACAFGSERVTEGIEPLEMIDGAYLYAQFPLLTLPSPV
jgi:hypothetical protein